MKKIVQTLGVVACMLLPLASAQAGLTLSATRVVFAAGEKQQTIQVRNSNDQDSLFQAWIDSDEEVARVPFAVLPSISKVNGNYGTQDLQILFQGVALPQDRESMYWVNVQEVPKVNKNILEGSASGVMFSIRQRIKLYYRPADVKTNALDATEALQFNLVPNHPNQLRINNVSGNYVTLVGLQTTQNDKDISLLDSMLLVPLTEVTVDLADGVRPSMVINFRSIDDYGYQRLYAVTLDPTMNQPKRIDQ